MESDSGVMFIVPPAAELDAEGEVNVVDCKDELTRDRIGDIYTRLACELWNRFYAQCFDPELADDTLNEAFARLQNYKGKPIRNPRAWLMRVGTNWLIDFSRRKSHNGRSLNRYEEPVSHNGGPPADLLLQEIRDYMREALGILKPDDRLVLVLRYGVGWSSARIADILQVATPTVDMRLSRARRRLRQLLEHDGIGSDDV